MSSGRKTENIILCFANEVFSDVFEIAFESGYRDCAVAPFRNVAGAVKEMARLGGDASMLVDAAAFHGEIAGLAQERDLLARRTHLFLLGGSPALLPQGMPVERVSFLPGDATLREVLARVEGMARLEEKAQQYCRISLSSLLVRTQELRCDVYIRLAEGKYVKVLHASDRFDGPDFQRFTAKKVEHLFLLRSDFLDLIEEMLQKAGGLNEAPGLSALDEAISLSGAIYQTVHAAIETEGFTPELQKLVVAATSLAVGTIAKNPTLSEMLARLDANREGYLAWHSTALSFLSCKLATLMGWQSENTFYKLSLASFLHDITVPNDELGRLAEFDQLNMGNLSLAERTAVWRHPHTAAQLLNGFAEIPGEVGFIVAQHHERQDGKGFPEGLEAKDISVVSALFVISHDIVASLFEQSPSRFRIDEFLKRREREQRYTKGAFGQIFKVLLETQL